MCEVKCVVLLFLFDSWEFGRRRKIGGNGDENDVNELATRKKKAKKKKNKTRFNERTATVKRRKEERITFLQCSNETRGAWISNIFVLLFFKLRAPILRQPIPGCRNFTLYALVSSRSFLFSLILFNKLNERERWRVFFFFWCYFDFFFRIFLEL